MVVGGLVWVSGAAVHSLPFVGVSLHSVLLSELALGYLYHDLYLLPAAVCCCLRWHVFLAAPLSS